MLLLIFLRTLYLYSSNFFLDHHNFLKLSVFNIDKYFSIYLDLSKVTTPIFLFWFIIKISLLFKIFCITCLYFYGTWILIYFSLVLYISHIYFSIVSFWQLKNLLHEYAKNSLTRFNKIAHDKNSHLICKENLLIGFCALQVFSEGISE